MCCVTVLNYENVTETSSGTDEDDRTAVSTEDELADGGGAGSAGGGGEEEEASDPTGVPPLEPSPRVAYALFSCHDQERSEVREKLHLRWKLSEDKTGGDRTGELSHMFERRV